VVEAAAVVVRRRLLVAAVGVEPRPEAEPQPVGREAVPRQVEAVVGEVAPRLVVPQRVGGVEVEEVHLLSPRQDLTPTS
jgi:hypothetical protein